MLKFLATVWDWYDFTLFYGLAVSFIVYRLPKRKYFIFKALIFIVLLIGFASLWRALNIGGNSSSVFVKRLEYLIPYLVVILGVKCCFNCSFIGAFFSATAGYFWQYFTEKICSLCFITLEIEHIFPLTFLISVLITVIISLVIWLMFIRNQKHAFQEIKIDNVPQLLLSASIILVSVYLDAMIMNAFGGMPNDKNIRVFIFSAVMVTNFVSLLLEFNLLNKKQLTINNENLKYQLVELKELYEKDKHDIELVNIRCHDIRHQIRAMKLNEAAEEELTSAIDVYDSRIKTGNVALDVILAKFNLYCKNNNIKFTCMLDGTKLNSIPEHEIYALFGNAIENAIHAVSALEEEKRIISITQSSYEELINIRITNFFKGDLEWQDGLPLSQRKGHGFGMRSMRRLIENYGGRMHIHAKDDLFVLNIFLPSLEK